MSASSRSTQSDTAPEGASRCRMWTSGIVLYHNGSRSVARVLKIADRLRGGLGVEEPNVKQNSVKLPFFHPI
ncbi:hypothetical protein ECB98_14530 [Brucellaceae bacterium VT-16-1752]|uniref:Uncharacterized protein n=1 Tax=Ochrobactrum teleogrylli TaxID=2479765 RepID=A0ABY2Y1L2_9HYPH|nr:hypothetical protein ECB98_14530 [Brucellaceae bacterium VT-16-1752]TNV10423.1 hypothetical protein FIC94_20245 [[Ochrobactrum] teleogrylli]